MHDVPQRHRSLRAAFDQSWRLLLDDERRVFSQLAVFRGSFARDAAAAVARAGLTGLHGFVSRRESAFRSGHVGVARAASPRWLGTRWCSGDETRRKLGRVVPEPAPKLGARRERRAGDRRLGKRLSASGFDREHRHGLAAIFPSVKASVSTRRRSTVPRRSGRRCSMLPNWKTARSPRRPPARRPCSSSAGATWCTRSMTAAPIAAARSVRDPLTAIRSPAPATAVPSGSTARSFAAPLRHHSLALTLAYPAARSRSGAPGRES
jgi:hypothetical protein